MKLRQALSPQVMKRLQHMVFAGVIVAEENLQDEETFCVKCLSPIPKQLQDVIGSESPLFQGDYTHKQNKRFIATLEVKNDQEIKQVLRKRVLLFRLHYANRSLHVELLGGRERAIHEAYEMIPVPQVCNGREELERKLGKGYLSFTLPKYYSDLKLPELLVYEGRLYGNLSLKSTVSPIMYSEHKQEVLFWDVDDWDQYVELNVEHLYFVSSATYQRLKKMIEEKGTRLHIHEEKKRKQEQVNQQELSFLQALQQYSLQKRIYIEEMDLYNFHICLKTNLITIVGGMSGIGKSQFVRLYGEALGLQFGKELLWIPILPSYQEPQDLLGYYHPNGTYVESETGLVRLLRDAEANPDQLFMVVFDEMNIAPIEHWFTAFLSLLELEAEKRILQLYTPRDEEQLHIPPTITIGENVIFVGTVNFDDTTKELSDRLLDRVNVVTFHKMPFRAAYMIERTPHATKTLPSVSADEFRVRWTNHKPSLSCFTEEELEFLDILHSALQTYDGARGISFRIVSAIGAYLENIPKDEDGMLLMNREEAFDLQVKQRVLTKIRGMETAIGPLLAKDARKGMSLFQVLQSPQAKEVSSFVHSIAYLQQKVLELELYGYAK
ncbi:AAA family ATPase [Microbacteriaceae bacterium 4G12]